MTKKGHKKVRPFLLNIAFCGIHLFISTSNHVKNEKIFRENDVLACSTGITFFDVHREAFRKRNYRRRLNEGLDP